MPDNSVVGSGSRDVLHQYAQSAGHAPERTQAASAGQEEPGEQPPEQHPGK